MKIKCKCGYLMTDTIVPNKTHLHPIKNEEFSTIFHCECCHRLYFFSSKQTHKQYIFSLSNLTSLLQNQPSSLTNKFYIQNDYDEVFKCTFENNKKELFIYYHNKIATYTLEALFINNQQIYAQNPPHIFRCDKTFLNQSVLNLQVRCPCGWLINKQFIDNQSIINLYNNTDWEKKVKFEIGENESFVLKTGLCCEKCNRLMLPNEKGEYIIYSPIEAPHCLEYKFNFIYYFIKPFDEYTIDFESCNDIPDFMNKIFMSNDKKFLKVIIGNFTTYYKLNYI